MIRIEGTRFGVVEVEADAVIHFPNGLIGFPNATRFALLERGPGRMVGFLQSLDTPTLAFPVTDASAFAGYPQPPADELARGVGLPDTDLAMFVIVAAGNKRALEGNLLAPLLVDVASRRGAQVVLDPRKYSASTCLSAPLGDPLAEVRARMEAIKNRPPSEPPAESERTARTAHKTAIAVGT